MFATLCLSSLLGTRMFATLCLSFFFTRNSDVCHPPHLGARNSELGSAEPRSRFVRHLLNQPTNVTSFGRSFNLLYSAFIKTLQLSSYNLFSSKQHNYPVKISFHLILTSFPTQLTNCAKCLSLPSLELSQLL